MACQGRYLVAADTTNDKVYLMYGYPFEEFEYLDSIKVPGSRPPNTFCSLEFFKCLHGLQQRSYCASPGDIRLLNVPGCGAEDARLQVVVYAKNKVEELCR